MSNYIHYKVWDEFNYSFQTLNACALNDNNLEIQRKTILVSQLSIRIT